LRHCGRKRIVGHWNGGGVGAAEAQVGQGMTLARIGDVGRCYIEPHHLTRGHAAGERSREAARPATHIQHVAIDR
jgi:hypothetical protein